MEHPLKSKLLGVPTFIWGLQILYVAVALGLLAVLSAKLNGRVSRLSAQILYVLVMLAVNILWRTAIKKMRPGWF